MSAQAKALPKLKPSAQLCEVLRDGQLVEIVGNGTTTTPTLSLSSNSKSRVLHLVRRASRMSIPRRARSSELLFLSAAAKFVQLSIAVDWSV